MSPARYSLVGVIFPTEGQFAANSNADFIINPPHLVVNDDVGTAQEQTTGWLLSPASEPGGLTQRVAASCSS
jgi:hypothetical protein